MKQTPKFESFADAKRFFVDVKDANGDDSKMMVRLSTACVVVTTEYGDKVAFYKTSRGKQYRDSRGKKVQRKDSWGNVETRLAPLMISESEVKDELARLLQDNWAAQQAFLALQA